MNLAKLVEQMTHQAQIIEQVVTNVSAEQTRWRPDDEGWSVLEVVCHLYDEEREDFRVRLDMMLHRPGESWPKIDPQGWPTSRHYHTWDLAETLQGFLTERKQSITWLQSLGVPDWDTVYQAPWGDIPAGDMMAAWVAHDILHIRQLVELQYAYTAHKLTPYRPLYAGKW